MPRYKHRQSRRYQINYLYDSRFRNDRNPIAKGYSSSLIGIRGTIARHLARDDWYPKAVVIDRHNGKIVLVMVRTAAGISIVEFETE